MTAAATPDRRESTNPWLVLVICCMSLLIVGMDTTIVNVALPSIGQDLNASVSSLEWAVASYSVVLASLLLLGGSMGDRFGRARVFKFGLLLFTASSLACGLAPSIGWLIAFRAIQGVGGSMLNPVAMSIIRTVFEDPRRRAQAIGIWGSAVGISMALGPLVGGLLVPISWRVVFFVNIPIGLAAIALTARFVPESRAPKPRRVDAVGQLLAIAFLASLTTAIIEGPNLGWGAPAIIGLFAVAAAAIGVFIPYELRRREPLLDPRFFESRPLAGATTIAVAAFMSFGGFLFINTLYLQEVRGLSPLHAGLCTLPMAAMTIICSPISGRIVGHHGARVPMVVGGVFMGAGSLMLLGLSESTPIGWLLLAYTVFGVGFGSVNPPITNTAVSGMPPSQAGVAAALASTSRQIGLTMGVAVLGTVATARVHGSIASGLAASSHAAWALIGLLSFAVIGVGLASTTTRSKQSAERTARLLAEEPQAA